LILRMTGIFGVLSFLLNTRVHGILCGRDSARLPGGILTFLI